VVSIGVAFTLAISGEGNPAPLTANTL